MSDPVRPGRPARAETREVAELRAIKERQPDLADAVDMHIELIEHTRRIQSRIPLPWFELDSAAIAKHQAEGRPILRFEDIPLELTDLRLLVRQTADVLRRHGALEDQDYAQVQTVGRDMRLLELAGEWYRRTAERHAVAPASIGGMSSSTEAASEGSVLEQVL